MQKKVLEPFEYALKDDFILRLTILYTMREYKKSATNPEITKFIMEENVVDYFLLQHNIYELIKMEKIRIFKEDGYDKYEITPDGEEAVGFFEQKIPYTIRHRIDRMVNQKKDANLPQSKISADFVPEGKQFLAGVKMIEKGEEQFSINIIVPGREHAKIVCDYLEKNCEKMFLELNKNIIDLFK